MEQTQEPIVVVGLKVGRPAKTEFPISLEECLRRLLPKMRPEDRMKLFREWRRVILKTTLKREPTGMEVEEQIKLFRGRKFGPSNYVIGFWESLIDFVPVYHKENRRKKAQIAAAKRWSKKSEKTSFSGF